MIYQSDFLFDEARYQQALHALGERLESLETTAPIPYRTQNGGDYEIPSLVLKEALGAGRMGLRIHLKDLAQEPNRDVARGWTSDYHQAAF